MARGWESKSAEAPAELAEVRRSANQEKKPDPKKLELLRKKESILLSRTRVISELKSAQNPRYKALLNKELADLDAKLLTFAGG